MAERPSHEPSDDLRRGLAPALLAPVAWLGAVATLGGQAIAAPLRLRASRGQPPLIPAVLRHADTLFTQGFPLVGLIHVGLGSLLSMQAYFGAVIPESNGAVVGVGLFRNAAALMTGFVLAALVTLHAARDFGNGLRRGLDADPLDVPDRDITTGRAEDTRPLPDLARTVLARALAAALVGPVLVLWGAVVGLLIGAAISRPMLGVASGPYFGLFFEMLRPADIVGMVVKGAIYPGLAALVACHEIARGSRDPGACLESRAVRSVAISFGLILALNMCWFCLVYVSGSPFGTAVTAAP